MKNQNLQVRSHGSLREIVGYSLQVRGETLSLAGINYIGIFFTIDEKREIVKQIRPVTAIIAVLLYWYLVVKKEWCQTTLTLYH